MKRISLVIVLALALLVSGHSRSLVQIVAKAQATRLASDNLIIQATQRRTDAPLITTTQDAKKAIQEGTLGQIASKASNSLKNYPSSAQIRRIENPKIRNLLERGRNLLEAAKAANRWSATRLSGFSNQLDQYLKEAESAAKSAKPANNSTGDCRATLDKCNQQCHDRDAGYFCFFDCRLDYMICLGGTILFNTGLTTHIARVQQTHSAGVTP